MPDFERLLRKLHVDMADMYEGPHARAEVEAYYRGMSRARKEIAWICFGAGVLVVFFAWLAG